MLLYAIGALPILVAMVFLAALDEKLSCHVDNLVKLGPVEFFRKNESIPTQQRNSTTIVDFRGVEQYEKVCMVDMYDYGSPYVVSDPEIKLYERRACWRWAIGKMTVVGIRKDKSLAWMQIAVPGEEIRRAGPDCVARGVALLRCRDATCAFEQGE